MPQEESGFISNFGDRVEKQSGRFDVTYGLSSAKLTVGTTIVATTGGNYHGISVIAGTSAKATIIIYDNASTTAGNILDIFTVTQDKNAWIDRYIPVKAKNGITVSITGTGANGAIWFSPKG